MIAAHTIYVSLLIGLLPTLAMGLSGLFSSLIELSSTMESSSQNFCAGLILGAVAIELVPQVMDLPMNESFIGIRYGDKCHFM